MTKYIAFFLLLAFTVIYIIKTKKKLRRQKWKQLKLNAYNRRLAKNKEENKWDF